MIMAYPYNLLSSMFSIENQKGMILKDFIMFSISKELKCNPEASKVFYPFKALKENRLGYFMLKENEEILNNIKCFFENKDEGKNYKIRCGDIEVWCNIVSCNTNIFNTGNVEIWGYLYKEEEDKNNIICSRFEILDI